MGFGWGWLGGWRFEELIQNGRVDRRLRGTAVCSGNGIIPEGQGAGWKRVGDWTGGRGLVGF